MRIRIDGLPSDGEPIDVETDKVVIAMNVGEKIRTAQLGEMTMGELAIMCAASIESCVDCMAANGLPESIALKIIKFFCEIHMEDTSDRRAASRSIADLAEEIGVEVPRGESQ